MDKETAIRKISEKFLIPKSELIEILEKPSLPKKKEIKFVQKITPKTKQYYNIKPDEPVNTFQKKYLFTERDFALLLEKMNKTFEEIKRIGEEIGDSCSESETFHDNFGYEEGSRQQKMWTTHFSKLKQIAKNSQIVKETEKTDVISIGSQIMIKMESGEIIRKRIGSYITFSKNELSYNSSMAILLIGKKIGDKICDVINKKVITFTIEEIN